MGQIETLSTRLFGQREVFAVQIDSEQSPSALPRLARLSYWLLNRKLGSPELYEAADILDAMKWVRGDCGRRDGGALCGASDELAHQWIMMRLVAGTEEPTLHTGYPFDVARFNLAFHPTHGAGWFFLVACGDVGRLLFRASELSAVVPVWAPIASVESAIADAYSYLDRLVAD